MGSRSAAAGSRSSMAGRATLRRSRTPLGSTRLRLESCGGSGNNKWSTLDTQLPIVIDGRRIEPGIYYLAIERPEADGWRLALVEPKEAARRWMDAWAAQARPEEVPVAFSVALSYASTERAASELDMTLALDDSDMSAGSLRIEWGKHQLETSFAIEMVSPVFYRKSSGN